MTITDSSQAIDTCSRRMGGATIHFGPGAKVRHVELAARSKAHRRACTVTCTWPKSTRSAVLLYDNKTAAENLVQRSLEVATEFWRSTKLKKLSVTHGWAVLLENLAESISLQTLLMQIGDKPAPPADVSLSGPEYFASQSEIESALRERLQRSGNLENREFDHRSTTLHHHAGAEFTTIEEALRAVHEHDGKLLRVLEGVDIMVSRTVRELFPIPSNVFMAIRRKLLKIAPKIQSKARIVLMPHGVGQFAIKISSENQLDFSLASKMVKDVIRGKIAEVAGTVVWSDWYCTPEGVKSFKSTAADWLRKNVVIQQDTPNRRFLIWGEPPEQHLLDITLALMQDNGVNQADVAPQQNLIQAGQLCLTQNAGPEFGFPSESSICSICLRPPTDAITPSCGHPMCRDCFKVQCKQTKPPLACLGDAGNCQRTMAMGGLQIALGHEAFEALLQHSFKTYMQRNTALRYCPVPDCTQIYIKTTNRNQISTCASCCTPLCTSCFVIYHDGLTCEQYRASPGIERELADWKAANHVHDCPHCGTPIPLGEGCKNVGCSVRD